MNEGMQWLCMIDAVWITGFQMTDTVPNYWFFFEFLGLLTDQVPCSITNSDITGLF
jgi:hypothetical protein